VKYVIKYLQQRRAVIIIKKASFMKESLDDRFDWN